MYVYTHFTNNVECFDTVQMKKKVYVIISTYMKLLQVEKNNNKKSNKK